MQIIYKPWGREEWIAYNSFYCYKHIYINQGYRTSLQYHKKKTETIYIVKGEAQIIIDGEIIKATSGDCLTITPLSVHRTIAKTDLVIYEISTPEIDDVIRLEDDTFRSSGRIAREHQTPAFCIVMAGKGSRLGEIVRNTHKGLLPIRNQAIISHIINKINPAFDIIIAVNHGESLIKEYCKAVHSDRKLTFVHVNDIDSPSSGPGLSLYCCKYLLQRPFYVITSDCLIEDKIPPIDDNWLGVQKTSMPEIYSTVDIDSEMKVIHFKNKDPKGYEYAFIGLCAILDYDVFWDNLGRNLKKGELVDAFIEVEKFPSLSAKVFHWTDLGTIENYLLYHDNFTVPKPGAFTYKIGDQCVKLFACSSVVKGRICRASYLSCVVPILEYTGENLYSYKWVTGETLYDLDNEILMNTFLNWCTDNLWQTDGVNIFEECKKFYKDKTLHRINTFLEANDDYYRGNHVINELECSSISDYLQRINWEYLCQGISTEKFHGDLQFDNVIYNETKGFTLIDWRDSFGTSLQRGDMYYDLAKLYGGILMPYNRLNTLASDFTMCKDFIRYKYTRSNALQKTEQRFEQWACEHNYDLEKIKILTSLIYLNMSPLYKGEISKLLFFCGKYHLEKLCRANII